MISNVFKCRVTIRRVFQRTLGGLLLAFFSVSCGEHDGETIVNFTGDYRYYKGIAEFFDCKSRVKYYLSEKGVPKELKKEFKKLNLAGVDDDAFLKVKGYLLEEEKMEGIAPELVFVPVKLIEFDKDRGCQRAIQQGK